MATTCAEKPDSRRSVAGESAELTYLIQGTAGSSDAIASLQSTAPATFNGLYRQPVEVEPLYIDTANEPVCLWEGRVTYAPLEYQSPPEAGDSTFNFDTGGGTQHITQSLATINKYIASGTAPDFKGAIGVTADSVEGVDITVPVYNFSETHYIAPADVDDAYKGAIFALTGKVNNASFRGLAAGECLFLGASGTRRGTGADDLWEITYRFAGSANRMGLTIGGITGIDKKGWEYLWVRYQDVVDSPSNSLVKQPLAVYVEKVYDLGDFSTLGI
ncbi:MAG: hypothetical protein IT446_06595 [Phycisphaerales bacterium]|nr:hypothetical protein [Phycisphaerales bacterium]